MYVKNTKFCNFFKEVEDTCKMFDGMAQWDDWSYDHWVFIYKLLEEA